MWLDDEADIRLLSELTLPDGTRFILGERLASNELLSFCWGPGELTAKLGFEPLSLWELLLPLPSDAAKEAKPLDESFVQSGKCLD